MPKFDRSSFKKIDPNTPLPKYVKSVNLLQGLNRGTGTRRILIGRKGEFLSLKTMVYVYVVYIVMRAKAEGRLIDQPYRNCLQGYSRINP